MKYSYLLQLGVISLDEFMWRKDKLMESSEKRESEAHGIEVTAMVFAALSSLLATLQIGTLMVAIGSFEDFSRLVSGASLVEGGVSFVVSLFLTLFIGIACIITAVIAIVGSRSESDMLRKTAFYLSLFCIGLLITSVFLQFAFTGVTYVDTAYVVISVACAFISAKFLYDLPTEERYMSELAYPQLLANDFLPMGSMSPMMPFSASSQPVIYLQQPRIYYGGETGVEGSRPINGLPPQSS